MYPRKRNSCSYLVELNSNGMTVYGKVACYIVRKNVAYALLEEHKKTGRNCLPRSTFTSRSSFKGYCGERYLIGEHYLEVEEDGELLVVSCQQIVNRCLFVKTREKRFHNSDRYSI